MPPAVIISILQVLNLKCPKRGREAQAMCSELNWGQTMRRSKPEICSLYSFYCMTLRNTRLKRTASWSLKLRTHSSVTLLLQYWMAKKLSHLQVCYLPPQVPSFWLFPAVVQQCSWSPEGRSVVSFLGSTQASHSPPLWCSPNVSPGDSRFFFSNPGGPQSFSLCKQTSKQFCSCNYRNSDPKVITKLIELTYSRWYLHLALIFDPDDQSLCKMSPGRY